MILIPVILILLIGHGLVVLPCGALHRAGADETSLQCPRAGVLAIRIRFRYSLLRNREERRERTQVKEVRAGLGQMGGEGKAVIRSLDRKGFVIIPCKVHGITQIAVVSCGVRIRKAVPGVHDILRVQSLAVRPLQPFLDLESIGHAVLGNLGIAVGNLSNQGAAFTVSVQSGKCQNRQARTVNRAVQCRVQMVRFGSQVRVERIVRGNHISEILEAVQVGIHPAAVCIHHVDIIIEIDRDDSPGAHQLIFRLMHQCFTSCRIRLLIDRLNPLIVVVPVRGSIAALCHRTHSER